MTAASRESARSQMSARLAMAPSIEKTPSVAMSRTRASAASLRRASRSAMSPLLNRSRRALERRMPSMMLAWLSSSEMTASSGPSSVSNRPPLASKHEL